MRSSPNTQTSLFSVASENSSPLHLNAAHSKSLDLVRIKMDEKTYRWMHNEDPMAVDKLSDGIRKFYSDARKLDKFAAQQVAKYPERRRCRYTIGRAFRRDCFTTSIRIGRSRSHVRSIADCCRRNCRPSSNIARGVLCAPTAFSLSIV